MPIGDEGATTVADLLRDNKSVTKLTLNTCNIRAPGATALAETLRANTHLLTFTTLGTQSVWKGRGKFARLGMALATRRVTTQCPLEANGTSMVNPRADPVCRLSHPVDV